MRVDRGPLVDVGTRPRRGSQRSGALTPAAALTPSSGTRFRDAASRGYGRRAMAAAPSAPGATTEPPGSKGEPGPEVAPVRLRKYEAVQDTFHNNERRHQWITEPVSISTLDAFLA